MNPYRKSAIEFKKYPSRKLARLRGLFRRVILPFITCSIILTGLFLIYCAQCKYTDFNRIEKLAELSENINLETKNLEKLSEEKYSIQVEHNKNLNNKEISLNEREAILIKQEQDLKNKVNSFEIIMALSGNFDKNKTDVLLKRNGLK